MSQVAVSKVLQSCGSAFSNAMTAHICRLTHDCAVLRVCSSFTHKHPRTLHSHAVITSSLAAQQPTEDMTTKAFTEIVVKNASA